MWNMRIDEVLVENGFKKSATDNCLYMKKKNGSWIYVLLYVDDFVVSAEDVEEIRNVESFMSKVYFFRKY
jgi:hypothetical protein